MSKRDLKSFSLFVDGDQGTTGLELRTIIEEYQRENDDCRLTILSLPENKRKDITAKLEAIEQSDLSILCLPEAASKEIVAAVDAQLTEKKVKIIDTSTAFRTEESWVYGFSEIASQKGKIVGGTRVSNPGCYALAFVSSIRPISEMKMWADKPFLSVFGVSGYSGGGRQLIELVKNTDFPHYAPYSLDLRHKHIREMQKHALLEETPLFQPAVVPAYRGMIVSTAIHREYLKLGKKNVAEEIYYLLRDYYKQSTRVNVKEAFSLKKNETSAEKLFADKFLPFSSNDHSENIDIIVSGNEKHCVIHARLDNLGIGAARNAFTNVLLMLGLKV